MNVLQILPKLDVGGVERGTVELASYLVSEGHNAIVVSEGGFWVDRLCSLGAKHYCLPVGRKNIFTMLACVPKLAKLIEDEQVDIVHARSRIPAWIAYRAVRYINKKRFKENRYPKIVNFLTTAHGLYKVNYFSHIMCRGRRIIAPSLFIKQHLIEKFYVNEEKVVVIPRAIDSSLFTYRPLDKNKQIFMIVGRISKNKGHMIAIKAFSKVVRQFPLAELWIIGGTNKGYSDYLRTLELEVLKLGLTDKVKFIGPQLDIQNLISKSYVVLVPSIYPESFGRVVIEAQAIGRAVIASDIPALNELIEDGKTGLLAKPNDVNDWARKMTVLLENPILYERIAHSGYKFAQKFSLESMCAKTLKVYESVLDSYSIGFIKVSALGDVVLASYSLKILKKNFPNSDLCLISSDLAKNLWPKDKLVLVPKRIPWLKYGRKLKSYGVDIIYDLQNSLRSQLLSWFSGAYRRFGFSRKLGKFLLTDPVMLCKGSPISQQRFFLKNCGLKTDYEFDSLFNVSEEDKENLYLRLRANSEVNLLDKYLVMLVLKSAWPTKNLSFDQLYNLIVKILRRKNVVVVLVGTSSDSELAKRLLDSLENSNIENCIVNFVGKTSIKDFLALVDMVDIVITPDSAAMHVAYALRRDCIVYFGPTDPAYHVPEENVKFLHIITTDSCKACYKKKCPKGHRDCLSGVEELIIKKLYKVLRS